MRTTPDKKDKFTMIYNRRIRKKFQLGGNTIFYLFKYRKCVDSVLYSRPEFLLSVKEIYSILHHVSKIERPLRKPHAMVAFKGIEFTVQLRFCTLVQLQIAVTYADSSFRAANINVESKIPRTSAN